MAFKSATASNRHKMVDNADPVIPNLTEYRATFKRGFLEWSCLVQKAAKTAPQLSLDHLRHIETAFPDHPGFPNCLDIKRSPGSLSVTGSSSWAATIASSDDDDLAQFRQSQEITVTTTRPTLVSIPDDPDIDYSQWFVGQNCHVTILILAWAYVLSSRWTEIIPGAGPIRYTNVRPDHDRYEKFIVHLGHVSAETAALTAAPHK